MENKTLKTPEYTRKANIKYYNKNREVLREKYKIRVGKHCDICDKFYKNIYTHNKTLSHLKKIGSENNKLKIYYCYKCNIETSNLSQHNKTLKHQKFISS